MKQPKLGIIDDRYTYRIAWFDDNGEEGARVGDERDAEAKFAAAKARDYREFYLAEITAAKTPGAVVGGRGICWDSLAEAKNALKLIKTALKNADHPWPDWAVTAKAAGWNPPKGWKP